MDVVLGIVFAAGVAALFGWLAIWAWSARRLLIRWPASAVTGLAALASAAVAITLIVGSYRLHAPVQRPVPSVTVARTPEQVARGERLAYLCTGCHASAPGRLPLDGGHENQLGGPDGSGIGVLYAPNLTPAGPLSDWSDGEIVRAIREGIDRDGRPLLLMPSEHFRHLSDADVQAIVAYLRSQPPVRRETPPTSMNLIGTILVGLGFFPTAVQPPLTEPIPSPPPGVNAEHGRYLVEISGCASCHGADLAGLPSDQFGPPPGPNLTVLVPTWTEAQFVRTLRTGVDPTGHRLDPTLMPWPAFSAAFTDDELSAMYAYLRELKPITRPAP
ncbi:MAG TPA: cytochrome c [Chloroflexota bacterium]